MTVVLAICVAVTFGVSIYLMLERELKGVAMGVFLLGHAANISILTMSGSPLIVQASADATAAQVESAEPPFGELDQPMTNVDSPDMKDPPIMIGKYADDHPLDQMVDPLPQALILTAIVIGFGVMAFLLTLIVVTSRRTGTLEIDELAGDPDEEANPA